MPYISIESGRLIAEQKKELIERLSDSLRDSLLSKALCVFQYPRAILHRYYQGTAGLKVLCFAKR